MLYAVRWSIPAKNWDVFWDNFSGFSHSNFVENVYIEWWDLNIQLYLQQVSSGSTIIVHQDTQWGWTEPQEHFNL